MALSSATETVRKAGVYYLENILSANGEAGNRPDINLKTRLVRRLINAAIEDETQAFIAANTAERLRLVPNITEAAAEEVAHVVLREKLRFSQANKSPYRVVVTDSPEQADETGKATQDNF
jgi:endonuclease YncB( thermonuclease family)